MPNIQSSIKRVRSNQRKATYNKNKRSELRTMVKKAIAAKEQGASNEDAIIRETQAGLDRAVAKGVITKNTAARRKARIARTGKIEA